MPSAPLRTFATIQELAHVREILESAIATKAREQEIRDEARQEALEVAFKANDRRLDAMNEFRAALSDQAAHMVSRVEYDSQIEALRLKIADFGKPNWTMLTTVVSTLFVAVAGIWLIIGLKIDNSLAPVTLSVDVLQNQQKATVSEKDSTAAFMHEKLRGLEERLRALELQEAAKSVNK